jgi:hypothetical protein
VAMAGKPPPGSLPRAWLRAIPPDRSLNPGPSTALSQDQPLAAEHARRPPSGGLPLPRPGDPPQNSGRRTGTPRRRG